MIKQVLRRIFHPTNRGLRLVVGLMLVVFLMLMAGQSVAMREETVGSVVTVDETQIEVQNEKLMDKIVRLAKNPKRHLELLKFCQELNQDRINRTYTCTFVKQERIRGRLTDEQHMAVKFRARPFSVAMEWVKNAPIGDAVLYIDGKYKDDDGNSQMLVRPKIKWMRNLVGGHVKRLPTGPDVMKNTLRPVTQFGLANSLQSLIDVYELAEKRGECQNYFGNFAKVNGRDCAVLERYLPEKDDYPAKKTLTFIDLEYGLPVRVLGWDWNDEVSCNYEFHDLDFSRVLTDEDFTPKANDIRCKD